MESLGFWIVAIPLIILGLFSIYARRRQSKIWDWVLSKRRQKGLERLEAESLQEFMEGKASFASVVGGGKDSKNRKLIRIVITHLVLYLIVFLTINLLSIPRGSGIATPWYANFLCLWDTRYVSPITRNIILLVMVLIVFPLVSILYELERRKAKRKKRDRHLKQK